ncbi:MAG: cytochrome P450 [Arenicellales bacterium]
MNRADSSGLQAPPTTPRFYRWHRFQREPHVFFHDLMSTYGDVVRWRGLFDAYLIYHPEYARRVLAQDYTHFSKRTIDYRVLAQIMGKGLITNDGPHWVKQRKLMQPLFSNRNVDSFDGTINALTQEMVVDWERRVAGGPLWIEREMSGLTFRIAGRTLFGSDIDEYATEVAAIVEAVNLEPQELRALMTLVPWLPTPHNLKWKRAMKRLDEIVYTMIDERLRDAGRDENILDRLINARDQETGESMPRTQMRDEVVTLMLAGHETSANALTWTLYLLGTHPEVEQRLVGDLNAALGGEPASAADLGRLPYLKQVVQESMRLYPPVWGSARRCEQEEALGSYLLPAGSYVGVVSYALHRHPAFWPDPERFDPDRFTPGASEGRHSYCYLPFAAGPRTCIGANMAMLEVQLVLAQLLQRFELRPVPDHPVESVAKVTLKPKYGLPMNVRRR